MEAVIFTQMQLVLGAHVDRLFAWGILLQDCFEDILNTYHIGIFKLLLFLNNKCMTGILTQVSEMQVSLSWKFQD